MTEKEFKILYLENRLHRLLNSGKNIKSPGVVKKVRRQLQNLVG